MGACGLGGISGTQQHGAAAEHVVEERPATASPVGQQTPVGVAVAKDSRTRRDSLDFLSGIGFGQSASHSEGHSLDWINGMIKMCYPHVNQALKDQILPLFRQEVSAKAQSVNGVKDIKVTEFDFGSVPPAVGPLDVKSNKVEHGVGEAVEITWRMTWDCHCSIQMEVGTSLTTLKMGINKFIFRGEITVLLCPILPILPCVGAVQIYMVSPPEMDFDITGTFNQIPKGIKNSLFKFIRSNVMTIFQKMLVLPNRIMINTPVVKLLQGKLKMNAGEHVDDMTSLKYPKPAMFMELGASKARNLTAMDFSLVGKASSDPYVRIRFGNREHTSQTIDNNLNPEWGNGGFYDFLIFNPRQELQVEVFDDDSVADDFIGRIHQTPLISIIKEPSGKFWPIYEKDMHDEPTEDKAAGEVMLEYKLFELSSDPETVRNPPPGKRATGTSFLQIQVRCLRGLPEHLAKGARIHIKYEDAEMSSGPSKYVPSKNSTLCEATSQRLAEYLVIEQREDTAKVAEISGLKLDIIEKIIKLKPSFTCRWLQGLNIVLKDAPKAQIDMELQLPGEKRDNKPITLREPIDVSSLLETPDMTVEKVVRMARKEAPNNSSKDLTKGGNNSFFRGRAGPGKGQSTAFGNDEEGQLDSSAEYDLDIKLTLLGLVPFNLNLT